jgi:hypothetical protein
LGGLTCPRRLRQLDEMMLTGDDERDLGEGGPLLVQPPPGSVVIGLHDAGFGGSRTLQLVR